MEQGRAVHDCVLQGTTKYLAAPEEKPWLAMVHDRDDEQPVDRNSVDYLNRFVRETRSPPLTDLRLARVRLARNDGASNALQELFASDSTLQKVMLLNCDFGSAKDAAQVLAGFHSNASVTTLTIVHTANLVGTALGKSLGALLRNNPHLQRLDCGCIYEEQSCLQTLLALLPGLRANRTLKELCIPDWALHDEGLRLLVDAIALGHRTLQVLEMPITGITCDGLVDITRLLRITRLQKIDFSSNHGVMDVERTARPFAQTLASHEHLTTLIMDTPPDPAAALIFQALETNSSLEYLQFGPLEDEIIRDEDDDDDYMSAFTPGIDQLIQSLPRIQGLKRLALENWESYIHHAGFMPALRQNQSLTELVGLDTTSNTPSRGSRSPEQQATVVAIKNILTRNSSADGTSEEAE